MKNKSQNKKIKLNFSKETISNLNQVIGGKKQEATGCNSCTGADNTSSRPACCL